MTLQFSRNSPATASPGRTSLCANLAETTASLFIIVEGQEVVRDGST